MGVPPHAHQAKILKYPIAIKLRKTKEDLLCIANPLLKWQRVTLTLLFTHILHDF